MCPNPAPASRKGPHERAFRLAGAGREYANHLRGASEDSKDRHCTRGRVSVSMIEKVPRGFAPSLCAPSATAPTQAVKLHQLCVYGVRATPDSAPPERFRPRRGPYSLPIHARACRRVREPRQARRRRVCAFTAGVGGRRLASLCAAAADDLRESLDRVRVDRLLLTPSTDATPTTPITSNQAK
jgi:hypothetical protein